MMRSAVLLGALLVVIGSVATHMGTISSDEDEARRFVYDDERFLRFNPAIRTIDPWTFFSDPASASHAEGIQADIYRPLRTLLYSLEYAAFSREVPGGDAGTDTQFRLGWWHLVSVLLHTANAVLLFFLLLPVLRDHVVGATAGALLFAVHPLTSECVAWLSSQGDLLALTLVLSALLVLARRGIGRTCLGVLLFVLACLAKESALMLPGLLLLRDLALPRGNDDGLQSASPWGVTTLVRVGSMAACAGLYLLVRGQVLGDLAQVPHPYGSVAASIRGMLASMAWYAEAVFWPTGFSLDVRIPLPLTWSDPAVWLGAGCLGTILVAGLWGLRARRYVLVFAVLGVLVCLVPVSNVLVPLKAFVADRFFYPALVGVAAGFGAALASLRGRVRLGGLVIATLVLVALAIGSVQRDACWSDRSTLWESVRKDRPANPNAYYGLAFDYAERGMMDRAERAYRTYLEFNPIDGKAIANLGHAFGRLAEGLVGTDAEFHRRETNLGLRHKQARVAQIQVYMRALDVWNTLGMKLGRGSEEMLRDMLERWIGAGLDLGDVATSKHANDEYLRRLGHDPRDAKAVQRDAPWRRRRARVFIALAAARAPLTRTIEEAHRSKVLADRAAVLTDVGLEPAREPRALVPDLERLVRGLIEEAVQTAGLRPDAHLFLHHAGLLGAMGEADAALGTVERGLRIWPRHPLLEDQRQRLRNPRNG